MKNKQDYYELLSVDKSFSKSKIIKAYESLAKKYHPDNNLNIENEFLMITEAAIVLTDKKKKKLYDEGGFEKLYGQDLQNYAPPTYNEALEFLQNKRLSKNNEIKNQNFKDFQDKYYGLSNEFKFNSLNWRTDGMIFIFSTLFIPLICCLIAKILFPATDSSASALQMIYIISASIGALALITIHKGGYFKYGYAWQFLFIVIPLLAILLGIVFSSINKDILNMLANLIPKLVLLVLIVVIDKRLIKRIIETIKKQWKPLIITVVVGFILMILIGTFFSSVIEGLLFKLPESKNQESLKGLLDNADIGMGYKVVYALLLFMYSVIVAPFVEEVAFRNAYFLNVSNKWLAFVTSSIAFGFIHYGFTGDFSHALSYSAGAFVLGGIFVWTKGNVTHTWLIHFANNLFAIILLFSSVNW
ncbi:CAAX amino terminal membrane bound protease [Spiroplasma gladiatoris]|uniref:CAAX amino terminal membrane bound protease n=1 Tax=Spiroplasma gladiatoris TaxID=2143 RepID=A0A4P7AGR6_9MOLU|nr:DnaJ domain-containing protein [Spiroplasma gladiatoris]QBQ07332.1 CAAX amino terminal membrane bound protease [Spiroplasma gladiatoris]